MKGCVGGCVGVWCSESACGWVGGVHGVLLFPLITFFLRNPLVFLHTLFINWQPSPPHISSLCPPRNTPPPHPPTTQVAELQALAEPLLDFDLLNKLHWDDTRKMYLDYGRHSEGVTLERVIVTHPQTGQPMLGEMQRVVKKKPKLGFVPQFGYGCLGLGVVGGVFLVGGCFNGDVSGSHKYLLCISFPLSYTPPPTIAYVATLAPPIPPSPTGMFPSSPSSYVSSPPTPPSWDPPSPTYEILHTYGVTMACDPSLSLLPCIMRATRNTTPPIGGALYG